MHEMYIVRHGQDEDTQNKILNGQRDTKLTPVGINEVISTAHKLKGLRFPFNKIYTSPLSRANETATIIADILQVSTVIEDKDLMERGLGKYEGLSLSDVDKLDIPRFTCDRGSYILEGDGVETFEQMETRASRFLNRITISDYNLVVTHAFFAKILRSCYYGLNWQDGLKTAPKIGTAEFVTL